MTWTGCRALDAWLSDGLAIMVCEPLVRYLAQKDSIGLPAMKRATTTYLLLWFCLFSSRAAEAQDLPGMESISGRSYRAIQAAVPHLERYKLNVADYRIWVWEDTRRVESIQDGRTIFTTESFLIVSFLDPDDQPGEKKIRAGKKPSFSVKLVKDDFRVIAAYFDL